MTAESTAFVGDMSDDFAGKPAAGDILDGVATVCGEAVAVNGLADAGPLLEMDGVLIFNLRVFFVPSILRSANRDDGGSKRQREYLFRSEYSLSLSGQTSDGFSARFLVFVNYKFRDQ